MGLMSVFKRQKQPSCDDVLEVLQSYLDGETEAKVARRVAVHLHKSANCEPESAIYIRIKETLHYTSCDVDPTVLSRLEQFGQRLVTGEIVASQELEG